MSKLLDQVRHAVRLKRYSLRTAEAYIFWIKKYIYFLNARHPAGMREKPANFVLTHHAVKERDLQANQITICEAKGEKTRILVSRLDSRALLIRRTSRPKIQNPAGSLPAGFYRASGGGGGG